RRNHQATFSLLRLIQSAARRSAVTVSRLPGLTGWARRGAAFGAGVAAALAFAPFNLIPLMAVGFSALILLLDGVAAGDRPLRAAFAVGWFFGAGYFLVSVYWMMFSFFVQAEQFAWMAPFALFGMPAFLALFSAGACVAAMRFWSAGPARGAAFVAAWCVVEYARGHVLTGLPWNLAGQAFAVHDALLQPAAWVGVYGLTALAVALAVAPAVAPRARFGVGAALAGLAAFGLIGAVRLAVVDPGVRDDIRVRIVQPNIPQREKIDPALWWPRFDKHLALSAPAAPLADGERFVVVWPENAAPLIDETPQALARLGAALPTGATLVTGGVRRDPDGVRFYNAVAVLQRRAEGVVASGFYDKHHLVPFGEYLPLGGLLRAIGLAQLAPYESGFTPGAGPRTLRTGGAPPFAPLICYETIFAGRVHPKDDRPEWLVTVTNDAWYGDSAGPRQHLDQARLRSVETGLPMARSANTGISALIDARGRVLQRIALYNDGAIEAPLPAAAGPTLYGRFGDWAFFAMTAAFAFWGIGARTASQNPSDSAASPR
ncbi:MAG: apolipoprotein N-acyltransferase, partial [Pseudomonadota bacterium]